MDVFHRAGVLDCEGSRRGEGVAAMGRNHLLVRLETPENLVLAAWTERRVQPGTNGSETYAPPELSEPAMTRTRPLAIALGCSCSLSRATAEDALMATT